MPLRTLKGGDQGEGRHRTIKQEPVSEGGASRGGYISSNHHPVASHSIFNPIAHIVWLENHALKLKNDTAKHISVKKSNSFHKHLRNFLSFPCHKCSEITSWQTCHDLFYIAEVTYCLRNHVILEKKPSSVKC